MKPSCAWLRSGLCFVAVLWVGHGAADGLTPGSEDFLVRTWDQEDGLPHASATALAQTPDGFLWVGTFDGLVRFDGLEMRVYRRKTTPGLPSDAICLGPQFAQ
jgi:ligand-binding sensor domain-containing protein